MKPVLLDTGVIVALLDRDERHHKRCVGAVGELDAPLVTCEAVIAEACYLLRGVSGAPDAILRNVAEGIFQIPFRLSEQADAVGRLLRKYRDVPMDLADACLVDLADRVDTPRILTLDEDFSIYRWRSRRAFESLIDLPRTTRARRRR